MTNSNQTVRTLAEVTDSSNRSSEAGGDLDRMVGNAPITDEKSKSVMIAAERNDHVKITEVVRKFGTDRTIPSEVTILKKTGTYYGPELMVHSSDDGEDSNFLITAPGPTSHLHLWAAELDEETHRRQGWLRSAEIKAALAAEQPPYSECGICGEMIRTIEHERKAALGTCQR